MIPALILVVDDEPAMRRVLEIGLRRLGHTVRLACNGQEALDRLALVEMQINAEAPRKTLLQAIDAEKLRRADEQLQKDQAEKAAQALEEAHQQVLQARVALINLPPTTSEADRAAAAAAVEEAEARFKALSHEGE